VKTLLLAALLYCAIPECIPAAPDGFVIDPTLPFVFIKFDHAGPRQAAIEGEGSDGIWFRIVNNCRVPITVETFDPGTADPGVGINYAVVPNPATPSGRPHPDGYSFHVVTSSVVGPGRNILFSLPLRNMGSDWHIEVRFEFALPEIRSGTQPHILTSFYWTDLPKALRDQQTPFK
jgi:hypothetical protein